MDEVIARHLGGDSPAVVKDLLVRWREARVASWADAYRMAAQRSPSRPHRAAFAGQLRRALGESALAETASSVGLASYPLQSSPPGGVFTIVRAGSFALASVKAGRIRGRLPDAKTRRLLAQHNPVLDPQGSLLERDNVTELAYFGCLVAVPSDDPMVPHLAFGVPRPNLRSWIEWTSLELTIAALDKISPVGVAPVAEIPDLGYPKLILPKARREGDQEAG